MSALGQKQTSRPEISMSALPPKADVAGRRLDVRFVPKADSCTATNSRLFDHLVGACKDVRRNVDTNRLCSLEIERKPVLGGLLDR
jgi:hypothetical protein